jgi:chitin synthase
MALLPTFVNILNTYSFCNLHDLSWGTKGLESSDGHGPKAGEGKNGNYKDAVAQRKAEEDRKKKEADIKDRMEGHFQFFRSCLLIFWLLSQMGFAYLVITFDTDGSYYLKYLFYVVAFFNCFRLVGSIAFLIIQAKLGVFKCCIRGVMKDRLNAKQKKNRQAQAMALPNGNPV